MVKIRSKNTLDFAKTSNRKVYLLALAKLLREFPVDDILQCYIRLAN